MNINNVGKLISGLAGYFNENNEIKLKAVHEWLDKQNVDEHLNTLYEMVLENCKYFPGVAEIKTHLEKLTGKTSPNAFKIAWRAAERHGSYKSVEFEDTRIAETIRRGWGTWGRFCLSEEGQEWMRKTFERIYNELPTQIEYSGYLTGSIEKSGSQHYECKTIGSATQIGTRRIESQETRKSAS